MSASARHRETVRVTLIGSALDLTLGVAKLLAGWLAHSQALIADGVHSLSDLGTDIAVIYASKHASRDADAKHPYGHGRIETAATVGMALAMLLVALGICYDAVLRLLDPGTQLIPGALALVVALISVLAKEAIYQYTMYAAERLDSGLLRANAWHSRTDALSSVVVIIGVGGALAGYPFLDAVAALVVALMIAHVAFKLGWKSVQELVDTGLSEERLNTIRSLIRNTEGVDNLHQLRTRSLGQAAMADVHIQVRPRMSVSEGHQVAESVRRALINQVDELADVTVHTDPEDDLVAPSTADLPPRSAVIGALESRWGPLLGSLAPQQVRLHYLQGRVHVTLRLALTEDLDLQALRRREELLRERVRGLDYLGEINVDYRIAPK